jgi:hypothetical protein
VVAPCEHRAVESAPGCEFPLGLGRELLPNPGGVRLHTPLASPKPLPAVHREHDVSVAGCEPQTTPLWPAGGRGGQATPTPSLSSSRSSDVDTTAASCGADGADDGAVVEVIDPMTVSEYAVVGIVVRENADLPGHTDSQREPLRLAR